MRPVSPVLSDTRANDAWKMIDFAFLRPFALGALSVPAAIGAAILILWLRWSAPRLPNGARARGLGVVNDTS